MLNKSYEILSGNAIVAIWSNYTLNIINPQLAPLYLVNTGNFEEWLKSRAIDNHRPNSRLLKKALRLSLYDDVAAVINANAQTITDNYWIREQGETILHDDVRFNTDIFSNLSLKGDYDSFNNAANCNSYKHCTPELTNIGSFEKCWKLKNNQWLLYKVATPLQQLSEVFTYRLGSYLHFNMAEYHSEDSYTVSKDFTGNASVNYEPAFSFLGDNDDYFYAINKLQELDKNNSHLVDDYIKLIFMDTLVANPDRHTFNFGIVRNIISGEIISLAPNFDNNLALFSRGIPNNISRKNDILVQLFNDILKKYPKYITILPIITDKIIQEILKSFDTESELKNQIVEFILAGYQQIKLYNDENNNKETNFSTNI